MKKCKSIISVALVVLVIVLCGMLPRFVAYIEDSFTEEMTYGDIKTMEFSHELSDLEKLYLVVYGNKVDISDESATLGYEEVLAVAEEKLEPYFNAGLIVQPKEVFETSICKPMFCYSNTYGQNELSGVFWVVHLESKEKEKEEITIWVDEISKKIVWIYFYSNDECYSPETLGEMAVLFRTLFMEDKDLLSAENETYVSEYQDIPYLYYISYSVENAIYGNLHLEFWTTPNGFEVKYYSGNMHF